MNQQENNQKPLAERIKELRDGEIEISFGNITKKIKQEGYTINGLEVSKNQVYNLYRSLEKEETKETEKEEVAVEETADVEETTKEEVAAKKVSIRIPRTNRQLVQFLKER